MLSRVAFVRGVVVAEFGDLGEVQREKGLEATGDFDLAHVAAFVRTRGARPTAPGR